MATTALSILRQELAYRLGYGDAVGASATQWTTTAGHVSSATVVSTALRDYGFDDFEGANSGDDYFQNWWIKFNSGNNTAQPRRIKNYTASTGTLTVAGTNLTTDSSAITFELHKFNPLLLRDSLNVAARRAFPLLSTPVQRTLFTGQHQVRYEVPSAIIGRPDAIYMSREIYSNWGDNILSNAGFETFSGGAFTSWSADSGITVAQETSTTTPLNYAVFRDNSAARLTNGTTGTARNYEQTISSPGTHSGQRINLSIWVYCLEANTVSTEVTTGSLAAGTAAGGGLHGGTGWELLTQTVDATTTLSTLKMGVRFAATASTNLEIYVDEAICVVGPTQEPEYYYIPLYGWEYTPLMQGTTLRNEVVFPYQFQARRRLVFEGKGYLSTLTADTDTVEIGAPQTELLYQFAVEELYKRLAMTGADQDAEYVRSILDRSSKRIQDYTPYSVPLRAKVDAGPHWGR